MMPTKSIQSPEPRRVATLVKGLIGLFFIGLWLLSIVVVLSDHASSLGHMWPLPVMALVSAWFGVRILRECKKDWGS
jgi:hypothetical protein